MPSMPNGQHSKASRDLAYVNEQLKRGQTRSGRVLSHSELDKIEEKKISLMGEIDELRITQANTHTTQETTRVVVEVKKGVEAGDPELRGFLG